MHTNTMTRKGYRILPFLLLLWAGLTAQNYSTPVPPPPPPERTHKLYILPLFSYAPETSLRLGGIGVLLYRPNEAQPGTLLSSVKIQGTYTLRNQPKLRISYETFSSGNKNIFKGFAQWQRFPLQFYGIGSTTVAEDEELFTSRSVGIEASYLRKITGPIFLGARGIGISNKTVKRESNGLLSKEGLITGNDGGLSAGLGLLLRFDNRDNNFNAIQGAYLQSGLTTFQPAFGSDFTFTKLDIDIRKFFSLFHRHVLAFQAFGEYNWGNPPFEMLALLGGDELMRGHFQGRFRDKVYWAAQLEYRLPINRYDWLGQGEALSFWKRWGMVGFAGLGTVAPSFHDLSNSDLKYSLGFGIRYLLLPKERVNIRVDFGFGTQRPGFYINVREAF